MSDSRGDLYLELLTDATALLHRCASAAEAIEVVANLVLPLLGDVCFVDILENGSLQRTERAAALPERLRSVLSADVSRPLAATNPVYDVVHSGKPLVLPLVGEEILRRIAVDAAHLEALRACGPKALLSVPLRDGGEPLGVMTLASKQPRELDDLDVRFVGELACRLGSKLEHLALSQKLAALEARDAKH
ncbi:MAG TPA: GAF domain-containing protein [Polyangia bacterium]|jgi:GAF domain-containing protein